MSTKAKKDPAQQFIASKSARVRVLAGPGTGKSYCLKNRILRHVRDEGVEPEKILVLTFTSIAVQDLKKSLIELADENPGLDLKSVEVSTLHSLALRQLEKEKKNMRLMEKFEVDTMLRDLEPDFGIIGDKKKMLNNGLCKEGGDDYTAFERSLKRWQKLHNGFTLNDPIGIMCKLLKSNKAARKRLCYKRVLVDEYQDLNSAEQEYIELLTAGRGKLAIIGDDDQSIYEFKGASPEGIKNYVNNHPDCEDISFSICRRCPKTVVKLANNLISNNTNRVKKTFKEYSENQKGCVELITANTPDEEIVNICIKIRDERNADSNLKSIVVLAPTNNRGTILYEELKKQFPDVSLCYRGNLLKNYQVCESISYITLASNPEDMVSWRYLLGGNSKYRCASSYRVIADIAEKENKDILCVLDECCAERKIPYTSSLINRYRDIKNKLDNIKQNPSEYFGTFANSSDSDVKVYNAILQTAINDRFAKEGFAGVRSAILSAIHSPGEASESNNIRIMSLHAAKGLSAQMVIVMSAVEGLIPLKNAGTIEEQRRLFYVAITRCKGAKTGGYPGKLIISTYGQSPSCFIDEMKLENELGVD